MINKLVQRYIDAIDRTMRAVIESASTANAEDFGVMLRYPMGWVDENNQPYTQPTGKRLRPILMLLCAEANGDDWQKALPAAAAIEILHNFSLVHDDIQDNSHTRHGRPTVWKLWGRANAINVGDAIFALAHTALLGLVHSDVAPEIVLQVWDIFNHTNLELTRGQHLDMRFETQETVRIDEYLSMIQGKSASLIAASSQIGALVATENPAIGAQYGKFGLNIGLAFQIHDDILGIWGDPQVTGKSAATDIRYRKKSLPVLYGLTHSPALVDIYARPAFDERLSEAEIERAVCLLDQVGAKTYAQEQEQHYYSIARQTLEAVDPQGEAGQLLNSFIEFLFQRQF